MPRRFALVVGGRSERPSRRFSGHARKSRTARRTTSVLEAARGAGDLDMVVPTLLSGDGPPLVQSLAILEYLEEKYPQPPLMPLDLCARAGCERACADGD